MPKKTNEDFTKQEAAERFDAALRGAFQTMPSPRKSVTPKRPKAQPKRKPTGSKPA